MGGRGEVRLSLKTANLKFWETEKMYPASVGKKWEEGEVNKNPKSSKKYIFAKRSIFKMPPDLGRKFSAETVWFLSIIIVAKDLPLAPTNFTKQNIANCKEKGYQKITN